jgi:anti-sigma factor RsiW
MTGERDCELMRLIRGDLPSEAAALLRAELARDAGLRAAHERLAAVWSALELPAKELAPFGFRTRVMAQVRAEAAAAREGRLDLGLAPRWVRALAVVGLVVGVGLGLGTGQTVYAAVAPTLAVPPGATPAVAITNVPTAAASTAVAPVAEAPADLLWDEPTLAESWVDAWTSEAP